MNTLIEQKHLTFARHGESEANTWIDSALASQIPTGTVLDRNIDLTKVGEMQAIALGESLALELTHLSKDKIVIIPSPFRRALRTSLIALSRINSYRPSGDEIIMLPPDERLAEQSLGILEPSYVLQFPKLANYYDDYWKRRKSYPNGRTFELPIQLTDKTIKQISRKLGMSIEEAIGEDLAKVRVRFESWLNDRETQRIVIQEKMKTILVTHGGLIYASRGALLGEPLESIGDLLVNQERYVHNCSLTTFSLSGETKSWELQNWARRTDTLEP